MGTLVNGTFFIPALNGSIIDIDNCTNSICSPEWAQLHYIPSLPGNVIYLAIFSMLLVAHVALGIRYRTWGFLAGLVTGLLLEMAGYIARLELHFDDFSFIYFVISLCCLALAPALISASIYLCISRLATVCGPGVARFPPSFYTGFFIGCDCISIALQAAGGAIAATAAGGSTLQNTGVDLMLGGISFQVVSLFCCLILSFDLALCADRTRRRTTLEGHRDRSGHDARNLIGYFSFTIIAATLFIFVRCCFRVAELKGGFSGPVANNQGLFMALEGPMVMLAVIVLAVSHPGRCFGGHLGWQAANWTWKNQQARREMETKGDL
ncbi:hypothetical protein ANO11243_009920 [Dothideomycetidae sp. 11243]|nr:hypothetical protein ANO11243_009920 [fungal sp. No.11243]